MYFYYRVNVFVLKYIRTDLIIAWLQFLIYKMTQVSKVISNHKTNQNSDYKKGPIKK